MLSRDKTDRIFDCEAIPADELFSGLTPLSRWDLDSIEKHVKMQPDQTVFASGDQPLYVYVHRSGRAAIFQTEANDPRFAHPVEPNHIYGIIEVLSGDPFKVSMKTLTDSDFDLITRGDFLRFIREQPSVSFKLAKLLSGLFQDLLERVKSH